MPDAQVHQIPKKVVIVEKTKRRPVGIRPVESAFAGVEFPLCDAAVAKIERSGWELADAILAECSEPGENGVRNGSQAKMEAMQAEITKNHGIDLSLVRIRKLRKVASVFTPDRRRSGVSLEGHLAAGTPEALDALIKRVAKGTALTRAAIHHMKHPIEKTEQGQQKAERHRQEADHNRALQGLCRQLERKGEELAREKKEREQRYTDLCRSVDREPEPFAPPLAPANEPTLTVAEDLEQGLRLLLLSRGFDPGSDNIKQAMADFVKAILAQAQ